MQDQPEKRRSVFRLSNMQVVTILLVAGICVVSVTFVLATDLGRVPATLWDICTTPMQPEAMSGGNAGNQRQ